MNSIAQISNCPLQSDFANARGKTLLWFNLKTDANDDVLGFTTDWINAFAEKFQRVVVITHMAGKIQVAENVSVFSVGKEKGYSEPRRAFEFYKVLLTILKNESIDVCFAHMFPLFLVMAWPLLRLYGIPSVLWYGHKATPPLLYVAHWMADRVMTSTPAGFRIPSTKVAIVGQGVTEHKFPYVGLRKHEGPIAIASVARLSRIKNIHIMVEAVAELNRQLGPGIVRLHLIGNTLSEDDKAYTREIQDFITRHNIANNIHFAGSVPHGNVATILRTCDFSLNLAPDGAIDKAALEGMAMGLGVIVWNRSFATLFKESAVPEHVCLLPELSGTSLANLILERISQPHAEEELIRHRLSQEVRTRHGLTSLAAKITRHLLDVARKPDTSTCP